jgi:hypothetical protein
MYRISLKNKLGNSTKQFEMTALAKGGLA